MHLWIHLMLLIRRNLVRPPKITVDPNFNPFENETKQQKSSYAPSSYQRASNTTQWESLYTGFDDLPTEPSQTELQLEAETDQNTSGKTFQIHKKYVLSTIKSGVVLIHQNLAHQRILYEAFLENITVKEAASQQLLFPVELSFNKEEVEVLKELKEDLENTGFLFDKIDDDAIVIKGIPTSISESQIAIILEQLLDDVKQEIPETSFSQLDIISKSLSKSLAIKTGSKLSEKEQDNLVNSLFSCKEPTTSPYGKKIFETLTLGELDKLFGTKN